MTSKERLLAALKCKPVDRVPFMILGGESWLIERNGLSFKEFGNLPDMGVDLVASTFEDAGSEAVTTGLGCWIGCLEAVGCPIKNSEIGAPVEVKPCIIDPEKDVPRLKIEDIPKKIDESETVAKMMAQTRLMKKTVGDDKVVAGQLIGPFSAANMMVGVKEFMVMLGKRSPYVQPVIEYATEFCCEMARRYKANGADMVPLGDPCSSGDLISQKMYIDLAAPALEKLLETMKIFDATIIHICGKAGMRLPVLKKLGVTGFSVDSPVDLKESMAECDGQLCMLGNFDPNALLRLGTVEDVYFAAMRNLEISGMGGGYVLMPGCDLAATTPLENLQALVRASKDFAAKAR